MTIASDFDCARCIRISVADFAPSLHLQRTWQLVDELADRIHFGYRNFLTSPKPVISDLMNRRRDQRRQRWRRLHKEPFIAAFLPYKDGSVGDIMIDEQNASLDHREPLGIKQKTSCLNLFSASKPSILVVDDNPNMRSMLELVLMSAGYTVRQASNGREALHQQTEHPSAFLLVDIFMPEKEGLETIREIRNQFPSLYIIAMSGGGTLQGVDCLKMASHLGAHQTLQKPFTRNELLISLEAARRAFGNDALC